MDFLSGLMGGGGSGGGGSGKVQSSATATSTISPVTNSDLSKLLPWVMGGFAVLVGLLVIAIFLGGKNK